MSPGNHGRPLGDDMNGARTAKHSHGPMAEASGALEGRRVLITGASSGVGAAAVSRFAAEGANLALLARSQEALQAVAQREAPAAVIIPVDLADRDDAKEAVGRAIRELGGLDVVVTNHASAVFGHLLEVHPDDFQRTIDVTFGGAVNVIRAALPELRRSQGTIVATGSLMAKVPLPTWSSYAAAKHALRGFLNTLRIEEREQETGVRVAMVHPGPIDTPLFAQSSSATGKLPRIPPDAYSADTVARALVEVAIRPRSEVVLGGETRAMEILFTVARPVAERMLLLIDRWYRSGEEFAPSVGSLWHAPKGTKVTGDIPSRESLFAPLQLGLRMMPNAVTPLRLLRNMGLAGLRAAQLSATLTQRTPEVPVPGASLRVTQDEEKAKRGSVSV